MVTFKLSADLCTEQKEIAICADSIYLGRKRAGECTFVGVTEAVGSFYSVA